MSETVILSKAMEAVAVAAAARQRPKGAETTIMAVAGGADSSSLTSASLIPKGGRVGDTRPLVVTGGVSPHSTPAKDHLVLVARDNRRLVKDLMALLAIREATKDTVAAEKENEQTGDKDKGQQHQQQQQRDGEMALLKNRPGVNWDGVGERARATAVAAAVASLLHHTARKEFSSLAGEMIAIARDDDVDDRGDVGGGGDSEARTNTVHNDDDDDDDDDDGEKEGPTPPVPMLHADATALDAGRNTSANVPNVPEAPMAEEADATGDNIDAVVVNPAGAGEVFLSGPVPVRTVARAATPLPLAGGVLSPCCTTECCIPPGGAIPPSVELSLEQKLDKLLDSVVNIKADMHRRIDRLGRRVEQIHLDVQLNIDHTDRALLRNDLLLIGIPCREREDLQHLFRCVCQALEYTEQDIPQVDIRRQRPTSKRRTTPLDEGRLEQADGNPTAEQQPQPRAPPAAPIVVEFMFKTLRDQFYRAYQAKRVLRLSDIGFSSERRFFVNEVLTHYNQKLMGEAIRRKRAGQLHSVYTVDGVVHVQRAAGEKGIKVTSFACLN